jgi:uncharacterized protein YcbX
MTTGTVKALWRWPVIPLAGERLRSTRVDERGVAGDRQHVILGPDGPLTAEDAPALTEWSAGFPFNPDGAIEGRRPPYPILTAPTQASYRWGDPRLVRRLSSAAGVPVELVRAPEAARPVVVAAVAPDLDAALAGVNLQLELELPGAGGWAGRELQFADGVRLGLVSSRGDGPGIEARVIVAGRIVVGETVVLG